MTLRWRRVSPRSRATSMLCPRPTSCRTLTRTAHTLLLGRKSRRRLESSQRQTKSTLKLQVLILPFDAKTGSKDSLPPSHLLRFSAQSIAARPVFRRWTALAVNNAESLPPSQVRISGRHPRNTKINEQFVAVSARSRATSVSPNLSRRSRRLPQEIPRFPASVNME